MEVKVLERLVINGLRGIAVESTVNLTRLTVLVGPNGSGKSTILDAIMVAASPSPGDAIGRVVRRRGGPRGGARWLISGADETRVAVVSATSTDPLSGPCTRLDVRLVPTANHLVDDLVNRRIAGPYVQIAAEIGGPFATGVNGRRNIDLFADVVFADDNTFAWGHMDESASYLRHSVTRAFRRSFVRLIDARAADMRASDIELNQDAVKAGKRDHVVELLKSVIPNLRSIEQIDNDVLGLVFDTGAVPLALAGDGVAAAVRIALQLAVLKGGVVLLEEPEAFLHPRAIRLIAKVIWQATRTGVQCVLTTHSMELLDCLFDASRGETLDDLTVQRTRLVGGELKAIAMTGEHARTARQELHEDLL